MMNLDSCVNVASKISKWSQEHGKKIILKMNQWFTLHTVHTKEDMLFRVTPHLFLLKILINNDDGC